MHSIRGVERLKSGVGKLRPACLLRVVCSLIFCLFDGTEIQIICVKQNEAVIEWWLRKDQEGCGVQVTVSALVAE
jgi:hypothetical protein